MLTNTSPSLLSLPDDVLKNVFKYLGDMKYTLQSSIDAVNLASTNKRLRAIFASTLTHITPIIDNCEVSTFDETHFEKLVRIAGSNLRVLHLPDGQHAFVRDLPQICPRLEELTYVEIHHRHGSEISPSESSEDIDPEDHDLDDDINPDADDNAGVENAHGEDMQNGNSAHENDAGESLQSESVEGDNNVVEDADAENGDDADGNNQNNDDCSGDDDNANADAVNAADGNTENVELDSVEGENVDNGAGDGNDNDESGNDEDADEDNDNGDDAASDDTHEYDSDNIIHLSEIATTKHNWKSCATIEVIPRLQLRKLSLARPPARFFDHMTPRTLEELHLHRMKKHHLGRVIPLLSRPLKALTVTVHGFFEVPNQGRLVSEFIDALIPMVSHITLLTLHVPVNQGLGTVIETWDDALSVNLPEKATELIASARKNSCSSDCIDIDLKGDDTFRILSAANKKASITLSSGRLTVRDDGEGIHLIGLPLDDEYLDRDVTHLENVFILRPCSLVDHVCSLEWARRLAGHKLRVIRTSDARVLNQLNLSTEKLEYFCRRIAEVSDWTFLSGVRELYLLGVPSNFSSKPRRRTLEVMQKLPLMIDAFEGELIWAGLFGFVDCRTCFFLEDLIESAKATKEAIDRFVRRGGDAGTLQRYVETVLVTSMESVKEATE